MLWFWILCGCFGGVLIGLFVIFLIGHHLRFRSYTVSSSRLPSEFDGFRIAVISDLHDRRFGAGNEGLVKKISESSPDLVMMAGDMHEPPHDPTPFYSLISAVSARVPITYTEGNHDLRGACDGSYEGHLRRIAECGARLLNDASFSLNRRGARLVFCGQSWKSLSQNKPFSADGSDYTVAVAHDPLRFDGAGPLPDLMISGHVHGGILRLPFLGPVFAPGNGAPLSKRFSARFFFPKYSRGLYRKGEKVLAVTQGLGFSILPIRFIPPEVMILTLKREEN